MSSEGQTKGGDRGTLAAFVGVGPKLIRYDVDAERFLLEERSSAILPANIQYAWPHASGDYLYVVSSDGGPWAPGSRHHLSAFLIGSGPDLRPHGEPCALPSRPIHVTTDTNSEHVLTAYNAPSGLTVHRINKDGTIGEMVRQAAPLDFGIYAHQVRVSPDDELALLVTRGHSPANGKPEEPGALKVFNYRKGILTQRASVAPGEGYGFGPRHLDFHPGQPWLFVSLERQNKLCVFKLNDGNIGPEPAFTKETLADPDTVMPRQMAGAIHVHPNGRFVYVANRALQTKEINGMNVSVGGETNIAVYEIDQVTGEPTKIQNVDTHGGHPRTFALDPGGRMLIAANSTALITMNGGKVEKTPPNLALFRVGDDGRLTYVDRHAFPIDGDDVYWMRLLEL